MDVDAITPEPVAARAPHGGINGCHASFVLHVQIGAVIHEELHQLVSNPRSPRRAGLSVLYPPRR